MGIRTGQQYLDKLNAMTPEIYVNGEKIGQRSDPLTRDGSDHEGSIRELLNGDVVRVGDTAIRISVNELSLAPVTSE